MGHESISSEHLLLGLIQLGEGAAVELLKSLDIELEEIKQAIEDSIEPPTSTLRTGNIPFTKRAEKILKVSYIEGKNLSAENIGTEHLLLALTKDTNGLAAQVLQDFGVTHETVKNGLDQMKGEEPEARGRHYACQEQE